MIVEQPTPDINSQTVQNLLMAYYISKRMVQVQQTGYIFPYSYVLSLATYFDCKKEIEQLEETYYGCKNGAGYSLPAIDAACYKALMLGEPMSKAYNFKHKEKAIILGDLKTMLSERFIKIEKIFNKICRKYDIPQTFNLGFAETKGNQGMPEIK